MSVLEELENITDSISSLSKITFKHFNNNHRNLTFNQIRELKELETELKDFFDLIITTFDSNNYSDIKLIFNTKEVLISSLNNKIKSQIARTREEDSSPKNTDYILKFLKRLKQ